MVQWARSTRSYGMVNFLFFFKKGCRHVDFCPGCFALFCARCADGCTSERKKLSPTEVVSYNFDSCSLQQHVIYCLHDRRWLNDLILTARQCILKSGDLLAYNTRCCCCCCCFIVVFSLKHRVHARHVGIRGGGLCAFYVLEQFHFHWGSSNCRGSEHTFNGYQAPLEVRLSSGITYSRHVGPRGLQYITLIYEPTLPVQETLQWVAGDITSNTVDLHTGKCARNS